MFGSPSTEVLEEFRTTELGELGEEELVEGFGALHRLGEAIEAERLRWVGEIERRKLARADGYLSTPAWLADRFGLGHGAATEQVKVAAALEQMPEVAGAFSAGEVSSGAVKVLARAHQAHPQAFAEQESALVDAAHSRPFGELPRVIQQWSSAVEARGARDRAEVLRERRHLELCPTGEGMLRITGELDQESGEVLATAVGTICDGEVRSGRAGMRSAGQLRADTVAELASRYLADPDRPASGGERPHLELTMSVEAYRALEAEHRDPRACSSSGGLGGSPDAGPAGATGGPIPLPTEPPVASFDHTGPVDLPTALRLACDCSVRRIVLDPGSRPLDVGRKTPTVLPSLRRAVIARDRSCTAPGCDRPPGWCQVHHVRHWVQGGPTCADNLVLVCSAHHRMIHDGWLRVRMVDGRPVFSPTDRKMQPGRGLFA